MTAYDYRTVREAILKSDMPGMLKLVAHTLLARMPDCFPGTTRLEGECGVERKTVLRALARLKGDLNVLKETRRDGGQSSLWEFNPISQWRTAEWQPKRPKRYPKGTGTPKGPVPETDGVGTGESSQAVPLRCATGTPEGPKEDPKTDLQEDPKRRESAPPRRWAPSIFAPDDYEPTESHRARCQELSLDVGQLVKKFKGQEFNRPYSAWDKRFSMWIEDEKMKRETDNARNLGATRNGASPARYGSAQPNTGVDVFKKWGSAQPNCGLDGFEGDRINKLRQVAQQSGDATFLADVQSLATQMASARASQLSLQLVNEVDPPARCAQMLRAYLSESELARRAG